MKEKGKEEDADMNTSQSDEWTTEQQQTANSKYQDKDHDDEETEGERYHSAGPTPSVHRSRHDHIVYLPNLHLDFN